MIDNLFKEQLTKNNIGPNVLQNTDCLNIQKIESLFSIMCGSSIDAIGLLCINIEVLNSECCVYVDGVNIINIKDSGASIIPIQLKEVFELKLLGDLVGVNIVLIGGCFDSKPKIHSLPKNKMIVFNGENTAYVYGFSNDIVENNIVKSQSESNAIFVQTVMDSNGYTVGKITKNENVYFSTKVNNYTDVILLSEHADSAIFLQDPTDNGIRFVLLQGNKIVCKALNNNMIEDLESAISLNINGAPLCLVPCIAHWGYSRTFALKMSNGKYLVFILKSNNSFEKIFEIKAKNIKIIEKENELFIVSLNNLSMNIYHFDLDVHKENFNALTLVESDKYVNIIDLIVTSDNCVAITSFGHKIIIEI